MIKKSGFTLIEIMVAITIVAILATMAMIAYSSVLRSSRDLQRIKGLQTYQQALELYRHDKGSYLGPTVFPTGLSPNYLSIGSRPKDPLGATPFPYYTCSPTSSCTSYCLYTKLENVPTSNQPCPSIAQYNYSVSSP